MRRLIVFNSFSPLINQIMISFPTIYFTEKYIILAVEKSCNDSNSTILFKSFIPLSVIILLYDKFNILIFFIIYLIHRIRPSCLKSNRVLRLCDLLRKI